MKKIYAVHEYGCPSHFNALDYLVKQENYQIIYRELNLFTQLGRSVKRLSYRQFYKLVLNILFLLTIPFQRKCKIVLGLAPYNFYLRVISFLFNKHDVYYFTSYTCWDQSRMVHSKFYNNSLLSFWKYYLHNRVKHIFAVSELTRQQLVLNGFSDFEKISVVNHSFNIVIEPTLSSPFMYNFITVATLEKKKGIDELIEIFKVNRHLNLTIVGRGKMLNDVLQAVNNYPNIHYRGFIRGLDNLVVEYKKHSFLILNSKRTGVWEELFGMVVIEAMACGLIPITTNHPGPNEIIENNVSGFICDELDIKSGIDKAIKLKENDFIRIKSNAIIKGQSYSSKDMSSKWAVLLA